METINWLNDSVIKNNLLCQAYIRKVQNSGSKKALFDLASDANGYTFIAEMKEKGIILPTETIVKEFGNFINGRCISNFRSEHGTYTSSIYCGIKPKVEDEVEAITLESTLTSFIDTEAEVLVKENAINSICVDRDSSLRIRVPKTSRLYIKNFGKVDIVEGVENVIME